MKEAKIECVYFFAKSNKSNRRFDLVVWLHDRDQ